METANQETVNVEMDRIDLIHLLIATFEFKTKHGKNNKWGKLYDKLLLQLEIIDDEFGLND